MKQIFAFACVLLLSVPLSAQWALQKTNAGNFTTGMYWLKAVVGNKVLTEKFFKN